MTLDYINLMLKKRDAAKSNRDNIMKYAKISARNIVEVEDQDASDNEQADASDQTSAGSAPKIDLVETSKNTIKASPKLIGIKRPRNDAIEQKIESSLLSLQRKEAPKPLPIAINGLQSLHKIQKLESPPLNLESILKARQMTYVQ